LGDAFSEEYKIGFQQPPALPAGRRDMVKADFTYCIELAAVKTNKPF